MLVKPPVLTVADPEVPGALLNASRVGVLERDNERRGLNSLENLPIRVGERDEVLACLGPRVAVVGGEESYGLASLVTNGINDLLEDPGRDKERIS